jgi:hypothetical protein
MRKGQGISINVIVIAAIALLVLVILSTLVIRSGGSVNRANTCEGSGTGVCVSQEQYDGACANPETGEAANWIRDPTKDSTCPEVKPMCCRKLQ